MTKKNPFSVGALRQLPTGIGVGPEAEGKGEVELGEVDDTA